MKKRLCVMFFCLLLMLSIVPFIIDNSDTLAYSHKLISFSGTQISGGVKTKKDFKPINNYVVVHCKASKWTPPVGWTQPISYCDLYVDIRKKKMIGYTTISTKKIGTGWHTLNFSTVAGSKYDLYFYSWNFNYWNCSGDVYAYK